MIGFESCLPIERGGSSAMEANVFEDLLGVLAEERSVNPDSVRTEALRLYLNANPSLKLEGTLPLWSKGRVSLAKAAELVGLTVPELKEILAARGTIRETEGKSAEEMDTKLKELLP
jgi:predicted HTH domain antitoxin